MPLDAPAIQLPLKLRYIARDLRFFYNAQPFSSERAAVALNVNKRAIAAYLSILTKAGVLERIKIGTYRNVAEIDPNLAAKPAKLIKAVQQLEVKDAPAAPSDHVMKCALRRMAFPQAQPNQIRAMQLANLPSSIPEPTPAQRMAGR